MVIAALSPKIPGVSVALARIVEGPLLFLAIRYLRLTRKQLWACISAILAAATIIGGAAVFERFGPRDKFLTWYGAVEPTRVNGSFFIGKSYRPGSFIDSPLVLAFYLAGAMPFAAAIAAVRTRWRLLALIAFAACGLGLLVTVTRSGYIGGGVGLILVLALAIRNPGVRVSLLGIVLVASSGLAVTYAARNSQIFLRPGGTEGHRKALQQDIKLVLKKPLGYGLARTDAIAQRFKAQGIKGGPIVTESTILAKAIEGGIPGLILYLSAIFLLLFRLRASRIRALDRDDHAAVAIAAGGMGAVVGVFLSGMFLGVSELVVEVILWGCAGIALAFCATRPRENAAA
jgi:hypothetical protein